MSDLERVFSPSVAAILEAEIDRRVRAVIADLPERPSPWLTRRQLADYLDVPLSRIEKDKTIPSHRWDGRFLYQRNEVDQWLIDKAPR